MATIVLTGQRAVPARLGELGYEFQHPELEAALRAVLSGS
jgi:NAD dependent epimerase/dehydratase family enzyme